MICPKCQTENPDTQKYCGECATPLPGAQDPSPSMTKTLGSPSTEMTRGTLFANRYQIIEELGKGGMGRVYRVEDTKVGQEIALKLIKPEIASDIKIIERFRNELKVARQISHRNVCRMYDLGEQEDTRFITMEYVRGEDLRSFLKRSRRLSIDASIDIATQICAGLAEAHRIGIVHRDLKPANIMIDSDGNVRIMDFGIARSLKGKGLTSAGVAMGTPVYMSPEQAEGGEVDRRSDIYSLGITLYEMVAGRVPFEGDTPLALAMKHKNEAPQNPREFNPQVSEGLSRLVLKCLEKRREDRFQSAEDIREGLERVKGKKPAACDGKSEQNAAPVKTEMPGGTRWFLKSILGILLILAAVLFLWQPWRTSRPILQEAEKPSIAVLPLEDLSPDKGQADYCLGIPQELIRRLDNLQGLSVTPNAISSSYRGPERNIRAAAEELNVENILTGTLQTSDERLRIFVELFDVLDNRIIWKDTYEEIVGKEIFEVQDEVTLKIAEKLKINLLGEEQSALIRDYTENREAYDLYLKGKRVYNLMQNMEADARQALGFFEDALEIDPDFVLAYLGQIDVLTFMYVSNTALPESTWPVVEKAINRVLALDDGLAEPYGFKATWEMIYNYDWDGAERDFNRAFELNPMVPNTWIHYWHASLLFLTGRDEEAVEKIKIMEAIDPNSMAFLVNRGWTLMFSGHSESALQMSEEMIEIDPSDKLNYLLKAQALVNLGRYEEAIDPLMHFIGDHDSSSWDEIGLLGYIYGRLGWHERAREQLKILEELPPEQQRFSLYPKALVYVGLNEKKKALELFNECYRLRNPWVVLLKKNIFNLDLQEEPEFKELMAKIGLDE
jgi:serine/threonine protein kinase